MADAMLAERCAKNDAQEVKINLRARKDDRDLIDRAAAVTHRTRTEFMLDSSRQAAVDTLLDQRFFPLNSGQWEQFTAALKAPIRKNQKFIRLMTRTAPWES